MTSYHQQSSAAHLRSKHIVLSSVLANFRRCAIHFPCDLSVEYGSAHSHRVLVLQYHPFCSEEGRRGAYLWVSLPCNLWRPPTISEIANCCQRRNWALRSSAAEYHSEYNLVHTNMKRGVEGKDIRKSHTLIST